MRKTPPEKVMGIRSVARRLSLSRSRVQQFCGEGRIGKLVDGRWLISENEFRTFRRIKRPNGRPRNKTSKP